MHWLANLINMCHEVQGQTGGNAGCCPHLALLAVGQPPTRLSPVLVVLLTGRLVGHRRWSIYIIMIFMVYSGLSRIFTKNPFRKGGRSQGHVEVLLGDKHGNIDYLLM